MVLWASLRSVNFCGSQSSAVGGILSAASRHVASRAAGLFSVDDTSESLFRLPKWALAGCGDILGESKQCKSSLTFARFVFHLGLNLGLSTPRDFLPTPTHLSIRSATNQVYALHTISFQPSQGDYSRGVVGLIAHQQLLSLDFRVRNYLSKPKYSARQTLAQSRPQLMVKSFLDYPAINYGLERVS